MAQAGYTPISLYYSTTAAAVPVNTNLASGELAINIQDEKLYFKNAAGTVKLLASNATSAPVLTFSAGTTGFTPNTATSGAVTLAGTLGVASGGTGLTAGTSGGILGYTATGTLASSVALTANALVLGAGAGATPTPMASLGTTTTVLHGNASGAPTFGAVSLTADVTGVLPTANGGTNLGGATPFTSGGVVYASSSSALATGSALTFDGSTLVSKGTTNGNIVSVGGSGGSHTGYSQFQGYTGNGDSSNINYALVGNKTGSAYLGIPNNGVGLDLVYGTSFSFCFQETEALRLTSTSLYTASGIDVGFGTSNPYDRLEASKSSSGGLGAVIVATNSATAATGNAASIGFRTSTSFNSSGFYSARIAAEQEASGAGDIATVFYRYGVTPSGVESMRISSAGNLGLGITPSAWNSAYKVFQSAYASLASENSNTGQAILALNAFNSGTVPSPAWTRVNGNFASMYLQGSGEHQWHTAGSNSAGSAISFTQAMTLDASGRLAIGATSASERVHISTSTASSNAIAQFTNGTTGTAAGNGLYVGIDSSNEATMFNFYNSAIKFGTNATERAKITSAGDVQISTSKNDDTVLYVQNGNAGTASTARFDLRDSSSHYLTLRTYGQNATGTTFGISNAKLSAIFDNSSAAESSGLVIGTSPAMPLMFGTNSTERARIDSSGNLLVGTTSALNGTARLDVSAPAGANLAITLKNSAGGTQWNTQIWNTGTSDDNAFVQFATETSYTGRGSITYNRGAGLVAYNVTSDYRAKDISGPVTNSGALIDSVPVYMGKMKDATQERPMFIAHETPVYAHTGVKDAVDKDGKPVYQQMDASALIPVMWAEIQSLRQRLSAANL